MNAILAYVCVFITIITAATSQLLVKYQMLKAGPLPSEIYPLILFFIKNLISLPIILSILLTITSGLSWMGALSKLAISQAYPFVLLTFPIIILGSSIFHSDTVTSTYYLGMAFVIFGLFIIVR